MTRIGAFTLLVLHIFAPPNISLEKNGKILNYTFFLLLEPLQIARLFKILGVLRFA